MTTRTIIKGIQPHEWLILIVAIGALVYAMSGCSSLWASAKSSAFPAGGAAAGAAAGSMLGPAGTIGGAAVGAVVGHAVDENAQLRSGELTGGGALDKEVERWKGRASIAERASTSLHDLLRWLVLGGALYVLWIRRSRIVAAVKSETWRGTFAHLSHAFLGTKAPQ